MMLIQSSTRTIRAERGDSASTLSLMSPNRGRQLRSRLEEKLRSIESLGGNMLVAPTAISETASFTLFRDPEGNVVGLLRATGPIAG